jgi:FkbH-like protein
MANDVLEQEIAEYNKTSSRPLMVIDERPICLKYGERELGQKLYDTIYYHPTLLSLHLSRLYSSLLASTKHLLQKKVVVTDLDNTLWTGLIGEGPVQHQHTRQQILKTLRQKGVVLAICSKNDPKSICWDGALLGEADFVASQINWENKPLNLKRIAARLNLDLSDFVFIDDRDDEIAMVNLALPQIHTLSANSDQTWEMLEWWAAALPDEGKTDRTRLYRERDARESYLTTEAVVDQDHLLGSLNLKLDIREASTRDVARLVELINRTHQFNTNQQHVTPQRVSAWIDSSQHRIVIAEATDRFGAMGLISAMIVEVGALDLQIHLWVLSCRVFGYGIETAMLNYLKRFAQALNRNRIRGHLVATFQNGPCQEVYLKHGFSWDGSTWAFEGAFSIPDPPWLSINGQDRQVA